MSRSATSGRPNRRWIWAKHEDLTAPFATGLVSMVFGRIPSEISFEWVYLPPFFFTVVLGYLCAYGLTRLLNATGLSHYFWHPGLAFVAFWVLLTSLIGLLVLPP